MSTKIFTFPSLDNNCECFSKCSKRTLHDFERHGNMSWWSPVYKRTPFFYRAKRILR